RMEGASGVWTVTPGFFRGAGLSVPVVLGLIATSELVRRPFDRSAAAAAIVVSVVAFALMALATHAGARALVTTVVLVGIGSICSRGEPRARLLLLVAAFAAALYVDHLALGVSFGPGRAALAGSALAIVWSSTVAIRGGIDRVFGGPSATPRSS